jgi:hypothetical protein
MATRRKSIKLLPNERQDLVDVYLEWRIPIDQYEIRPDDLRAFVNEWQQRCGRKDAPGEVLHYMRTQRKRGLWVTFDGQHESTPNGASFTADEIEILVCIFHDNVTVLESGSDVLAYDDEIADLIAKGFAEQTGRIVPAHQLIAKLTALRKRGLLTKVGERVQGSSEIGFSDIDQVIV